MQRATTYRYFYIQRHITTDLLKMHLHDLEQHDKKKYESDIGKYLYEFEITDQADAWRVLKTRQEIQKFIEHRHNSYVFAKDFDKLRKIETIDVFRDDKFQIAAPPQAYKLAVPQYMIKFFEIYCIAIRKTSSFLMMKKVRALTKAKKCAHFCFGVQWSPRRILITKEGVIDMADNGQISDFLKFDLFFSVQSGTSATEHEFGIALNSAHRKMDIKARNVQQFLTFLYYLNKVRQQNAHKISYQGSCPRSSENSIDYYVDAKDYYEAVAREINKAKKIIMICGWWVSPELYLIRPLDPKDPDHWRLDKLLQRKAKEGVKIHVLVFFAPSVIPNDSDHTKLALISQHPNIQVQRHPHEAVPKLWSHHQKAVIVDQQVALMGGLDLCFGRYDDLNHPVNDNSKLMYPGIDYNNVRIRDFVEVANHEKDLQDRKLPRMPWHDVAFKVRGKIVSDVSNHFIEYWNFTLIEKSVAPFLSQRNKPVHLRHRKSQRQNFESNKKIQSAQELNPEPQEPIDIMELVGTILRIATQKQTKQFDEFIQNKEKSAQISKAVSEQIEKKKLDLNAGLSENNLVLSLESLGLIKKSSSKMKEEENFGDELQLLRSASQWSIGLSEGIAYQRSIQNAYLSAIKNAQKYIYIENQFFISGTGDKDSFIQNQIANSLYQRIKKAIQSKDEDKKRFKVIVFMPLLPGMQGQLSEKCPLSLKLTMYWQFNTISQSQNSLIRRVAKLTDHPEDYIEFYSLRNHGLLEGKPVTELIYIHTKLMIVDDNYVICGSANINDRSQEGNRDSELAVIFRQGQKISSMMDEKECYVNKKAHDLRVKLYMQHFGIDQKQAQDPLNKKSVEFTRSIANTNTIAYRQIFGCCPDDNVKKLADVKKFEKPSSQIEELYKAHHKKIRGHAVQFPTQFLSDQRLKYLKKDLPIQDLFA